MLLFLILSLIVTPTFTDEEINFMAGIVAGETLENCPLCHEIIATTVVGDALRYKESGVSIYNLHPGRWHGYRDSLKYKEYIENAIKLRNPEIPRCRFVGNLDDYAYWRWAGHAENVPVLAVGTSSGGVVCVPFQREYIQRSFIPYDYE